MTDAALRGMVQTAVNLGLASLYLPCTPNKGYRRKYANIRTNIGLANILGSCNNGKDLVVEVKLKSILRYLNRKSKKRGKKKR